MNGVLEAALQLQSFFLARQWRFCFIGVFKSFAARPLDWRDVEMTIVRQGDAGLDWRYIQEQLRPLAELKEQPELLSELLALRQRLRDSEA